MNYWEPIYTENATCQDCYKCLRQCPVKAIQIRDGHANIIHESCVLCGHCVTVCPVGAKKVRAELGRVKQILQLKNRVVVSLAPSYKSEFPNVHSSQIISALKTLGFHGVSETALGAQIVSANIATLLKSEKPVKLISSACPTVVEYIKKYKSEYASLLTDLLSPVLAHCKWLKHDYGTDIGVIFIGPCISKKKEADEYPEILDVAITFNDLKQWFEELDISVEKMPVNPAEQFILGKAQEGVLYPVDGGMIASIKENCDVANPNFMSFSGLNNIQKVLVDLHQMPEDCNLFLELLACEGGCVNGPQTIKKSATAIKRFQVLSSIDNSRSENPGNSLIDIREHRQVKPLVFFSPCEADIEQALKTIGKFSRKDELNCGACGYNSCRDFAHALLEKKAEKMMCVSYMRTLAQKKANAIIKTMPSGVVIVDNELEIVDCNQNFARICGPDTELVYDAKPGLEGASLKKVIPFYKYFEHVLQTGEEIIDKDIKLKHSILELSIFNIEEYHLVGGIVQDITIPSVQKSVIVKKAREVIKKNTKTVQQIVYLLGENAAESEVILNSIVESFSPATMSDFDPKEVK